MKKYFRVVSGKYGQMSKKIKMMEKGQTLKKKSGTVKKVHN